MTTNRWNKRTTFDLRKNRRARRAHKMAWLLANLEAMQ